MHSHANMHRVKICPQAAGFKITPGKGFALHGLGFLACHFELTTS
jgi:hypothetical protein